MEMLNQKANIIKINGKSEAKFKSAVRILKSELHQSPSIVSGSKVWRRDLKNNALNGV